jgi:protein SCO1/2
MASARTPFRIGLFVALGLLLPVDSRPAPQATKYSRSVADYSIPDVTLVNQDGARVRLTQFLSSDKPVLVDFVYATCTTISPMLSAVFSNFQKKLGADTRSVQLVSFTIDPENDTPELMKDYLRRYAAKPGWDFLTGSRKDIDRVMKAFDAYIPNKMSHFPITFLKGPGKGKWVRIYGLLGTSDLIREYQQVVKP